MNKKIGGILTEMEAEIDRVHFVVLGIGLNVNSDPKDLPAHANSLKNTLGKTINRIQLAQTLLRQIEKDYLKLKDGKFKEIADAWEEVSVTSGRRVRASVFGRKIQGQATGIDEDGALWIRKDSGLQERVLAGDVEHLR